jgi:hypothetical protein
VGLLSLLGWFVNPPQLVCSTKAAGFGQQKQRVCSAKAMGLMDKSYGFVDPDEQV